MWAAVLLAVQAATFNQVTPFTSKCPGEYCFLVTHGGWSFYRVRIKPNLWPAGNQQRVTDDVIYNTCYQASLGQAPPCMGANSLCRFYSNAMCQATSELGCEQPMLTSVIQMGCSSPLDPNCATRLTGGISGALWASMGGNWGSYSCGRINTPEHGSVFCGNGVDHSVDGTWWGGNCDMDTPPCESSVAVAGTGRTLEHYAFCVGKSVCTCVHGECDIASDKGFCLLNSCSTGWSGQNCNLPCTAAFCNGRNDPAKANGGVYTNSLNQCVCECLPAWGPGGIEGCKQCTLPGSNQCVAYSAQYLFSPTTVTTVQKGVPLLINVEARFEQNDQVDPNVNTDLLVELNPGGGNGGGGPITVIPNPTQMVNGLATVRVTFGSACDACVLVIRDLDTSNPLVNRLTPLVMPAVRVNAVGSRMISVTSLVGVAPGVPFQVTLQVVDNDGNIDRSATNSVRVGLEGSTTGAVLSASSGSSLQQTFSNGQATWGLVLSRSCLGCSLAFEDVSATRTLTRFLLGPIQAAGTANRMALAQAIPLQVRKGEVFDVVINAVDVNGDLVPTISGTVVLSLTSIGGGNGAGGVLINRGGASLAQPMVNGRVSYAIAFSEACTSCVITATDTSGGLGLLNLPAISVTTQALQLKVTSNAPSTVKVKELFALTIGAIDSSGNVDVTDTSRVTLTVEDGGGNGNGGDLKAQDTYLTRNLVAGNATFVLSFTRACDACVIKIADLDSPVLMSILTPPIRVTTQAVMLGVVGVFNTQTQRDVATNVRIAAVDANGDIDRSDTGFVGMTLKAGGGNGDGGVLSNGPSSKERQLVNGEMTFTPTFDRSCTACRLLFRHSNPSFPVLETQPIQVTTTAVRFKFLASPPTTIAPNEVFTTTLQAVDELGNADYTERGFISMRLVAGGNNGNGGTLLNDQSTNLQVTSIKGKATFRPSFTEACSSCRLQFNSVETALPDLTSDPIVVSGQGTRLGISDPGWASASSNSVQYTLAVTETLTMTVDVLDGSGFIATGSSTSITASLKPNGGNGHGGNMREVTGKALSQKVVNGRVVFELGFSEACSACVVSFAASGVTGTNTPPFKITTEGTRMVADNSQISSIPVGVRFPLSLRVVDSLGNTDETWQNLVSVSLLPNGGNGDGGILTDAGQQLLSSKFVAGVKEYSLAFSKSCAACVIEVKDTAGRLSGITVGPVKVTTSTTSVKANLLGVTQVTRNVPFQLSVYASDANNNVNLDDGNQVSVYLGEMVNGRVVNKGVFALQTTEQTVTGTLITKSLSEGRATFGLTMTQDCPACVLVVEYPSDPAVSSFSVRTDGSAPANSPSPPSGGGGDDFDPMWLLLIIPLILIVCCLIILAILAVFMGKMGKKGEKKEGEEKTNDSLPSNEKETKEVERFSDPDLDTRQRQQDGSGSVYPESENPLKEAGTGNPIDQMFAPQPVENTYSHPVKHTDPSPGHLSWMMEDNGATPEPLAHPTASHAQHVSSYHPDVVGELDAGGYNTATTAPVPPPSHFEPGEY